MLIQRSFFEKISCGGNLILDGEFLWGISCNEVGSGRIHRYNLKEKTWKTYFFPKEKVFARMLLNKSENDLCSLIMNKE